MLRIQDLGCAIQGLGERVEGPGLRGSKFRIRGFRALSVIRFWGHERMSFSSAQSWVLREALALGFKARAVGFRV